MQLTRTVHEPVGNDDYRDESPLTGRAAVPQRNEEAGAFVASGALPAQRR